jgi:TonB family protein
MLSYFLKIAIAWAIFYLLYALLLERTTFFRLNRAYLLLTLLLGMSLPLLRISINSSPEGAEKRSNWLPEVVIQANQAVNQPISLPVVTIRVSSSREWQFLPWFYLAGVAFCLARLGLGLWQLYRLYRRGRLEYRGRYTLVYCEEILVPFSFLHYLFWPAQSAGDDLERDYILQHEETHIVQAHTLDVLLSEIVKAFCWFNPLAYRYANAIRDVHEYLADAAVLQNASRKRYGHLLIRQSLAGPSVNLVHHFSTSQLKKRIAMMTKNKTQRPASLRYTLAMPIVLGLICLFAQIRIEASESTEAKMQPVSAVSSPVYLLSADSIPKETLFRVVEEMPSFPGGQGKLMEFLGTNIKYPKLAKDNNVEGMVVASFIVQKDGSITDLKLIKGIGAGCDEETIRVLGLMPKWEPGKQKGKTVAVQFNLPIRYKIDQEIKESPAQYTPSSSTPLSEQPPLPPAPPMIEEVPIQIETPKTLTPVIGAKVVEERIDLVRSPVIGRPMEAKVVQEQNEIFKVVENMPQYPGGHVEMIKFLGENVKYPKAAAKKGLEGMVVVSFVIELDGRINNAKVVKQVSEDIDAEALRVVKAMPKWQVGLQRGIPVRVQYNLPIRFKLDDDQAASSAAAPKLNTPAAPSNAHTQLGELKFKSYFLAPNPSQGEFELRFQAAEKPTSVQVTNLDGQVIIEQQLNGFNGSYNETLNLSRQPKGIYILRIIQGEQQYVERLLVQ